MQLLKIGMPAQWQLAILLPMVEKPLPALRGPAAAAELPAKPLHPEFGKMVSGLMDQLGVSVPEVAKKIGVTPEMVRRYRLGVAMPGKAKGRDKMQRLAALLGVDPADLYAAGSSRSDTRGALPGAVIVEDPDELQLIEAYRGLDETTRKILRARAAQLLEQFGRATKKNPYGKGGTQ